MLTHLFPPELTSAICRATLVFPSTYNTDTHTFRVVHDACIYSRAGPRAFAHPQSRSFSARTSRFFLQSGCRKKGVGSVFGRGNGIEETSDIRLTLIETGECETEIERWGVKYKTKRGIPGREGVDTSEGQWRLGCPGAVRTSRA